MATPTASDWAILARFGVTPYNLSVGESLYLGGTNITTLPNHLNVDGSLDLRYTDITTLPDNLSVGGLLHLRDTKITALYEDERSYRLDRAGNRYIAGCRNFTAAEAIAHWGHPEYPDPERGAAFVAAVKAEEARRNT